MKMKISGLTIFLIIISLIFLYSCYINVAFYNIIDKGTDKIIELYEEDSEFSSSRAGAAQSMLGMRVDARLRKDISISISMVLFFLSLLSYKVDRLKQR